MARAHVGSHRHGRRGGRSLLTNRAQRSFVRHAQCTIPTHPRTRVQTINAIHSVPDVSRYTLTLRKLDRFAILAAEWTMKISWRRGKKRFVMGIELLPLVGEASMFMEIFIWGYVVGIVSVIVIWEDYKMWALDMKFLIESTNLIELA